MGSFYFIFIAMEEIVNVHIKNSCWRGRDKALKVFYDVDS